MRVRRRLKPAAVAGVAPAIPCRVAVEDLLVRARRRHPESVALPEHRSEVAADHQRITAAGAATHEGQHAVLPIVTVDPFETTAVEIEFVEGRLPPHQIIQVGHRAGQAAMALPGQQVPVQALVEVPFLPLPEFTPHEEQLLAGMAPHVGVEEPQVGELLPDIPRHLIEQRSFAVHHLVVREGQHEVFVERVDEAEGQFVVVILAVHGIVPHVAERVVHPAHVPFQAETEPTDVGRP